MTQVRKFCPTGAGGGCPGSVELSVGETNTCPDGCAAMRPNSRDDGNGGAA
jgi:hypothetical protein